MNMENELLKDKAVRQAMCMAIDQSSLISRCEYDAVYPINMAWLPDLFGEYVNKDANAILQYDVAGARQLLEDAGYTLGDDGIYQKDGNRLSFTACLIAARNVLTGYPVETFNKQLSNITR